MDLGTCWQPGVWADGSWVNNSWCPESFTPCTPESIGECWAVVWCTGSWVSGVWCPTGETPTPTPTPTAEEIHLLEPFYIWDERRELKRKQEEAIIIL